MTDRICVSIFVSENSDGTVAIKSLAADDKISKAIERMSCEQIENLLKYMSAAAEAANAVTEAGAKLDEVKPNRELTRGEALGSDVVVGRTSLPEQGQ